MAKKLTVVKEDIKNQFEGVEKIKHHLFLKGAWPAILTDTNKIYIEVMKGRFLDSLQYKDLKKETKSLPEAIETALDSFYAMDWSTYKK